MDLPSAFNFIAGVTLAARLGAHSCSNSNYINHNDLAQAITKRCRELQAATAFFWFTFALFVASLVVDFSKQSNVNQQVRSLQQTTNILVKWRWSSTIRG
ncbi:hypothetical protein DID88_006811 [Monilinia fructigena]|uniref:MARVEL domain-containing protein n=1 Tax=Monilinia fructigena TaxID=38457 RepID=A0A395IGE6_9HELO|nr:hypothetical protein DID88_006811 [Monilinia fructigena]